jgi:hypothetical protein
MASAEDGEKSIKIFDSLHHHDETWRFLHLLPPFFRLIGNVHPPFAGSWPKGQPATMLRQRKTDCGMFAVWATRLLLVGNSELPTVRDTTSFAYYLRRQYLGEIRSAVDGDAPNTHDHVFGHRLTGLLGDIDEHNDTSWQEKGIAAGWTDPKVTQPNDSAWLDPDDRMILTVAKEIRRQDQVHSIVRSCPDVEVTQSYVRARLRTIWESLQKKEGPQAWTRLKTMRWSTWKSIDVSEDSVVTINPRQ